MSLNGSLVSLDYFIHDMYQNSQISNRYVKNAFESVLENYINSLNKELERLNYGYRIIGDVFVEITSSSEMAVIQESLQEADTNTVTHLQESLKLLSPSNQELSTRNAIKEAISAVEVTARQITNTSTLDEAFKKLRDIHPMINSQWRNYITILIRKIPVLGMVGWNKAMNQQLTKPSSCLSQVAHL